MFCYFVADSHNAQNASEKSHRLIGYDGPSNMSSIWLVSHAIRAIGNYRRARNLHWFRIKFCAANITWNQWKVKQHPAMVSLTTICMLFKSNDQRKIVLIGQNQFRSEQTTSRQLFWRWWFVEEENQKSPNGIHWRAARGVAAQFRNRQ